MTPEDTFDPQPPLHEIEEILPERYRDDRPPIIRIEPRDPWPDFPDSEDDSTPPDNSNTPTDDLVDI